MLKAIYLFLHVCFGALKLDYSDVRIKHHKLVLPNIMVFNSNYYFKARMI